MSDPTAPERQAGVLISGAFGTGMSSAAEEMATILECLGLAYAAIDWTGWRGSTRAVTRRRRANG